MTKRVKLTAKQLELMTDIQKRKEELTTGLTILNQQENIVVLLVMEQSKVTQAVESVKIEGDSLIFELAEPKKTT